jgi:acyl-CoA thioester hydrolase
VDLLKEGIEFRVTHAEVRYRSAATYGESLTIDTTLSANRRISITFSHKIRELTSQRLIVEGSATLVTVDPHGKVKRLAPSFLEALGISDLRSQISDGEN